MQTTKLVNGEWWEILPKPEDSTDYTVVNTHRTNEVISGATNIEIVGTFYNKENAIDFLNDQISFVQDRTLSGQDGFSLLYNNHGNNLTISISRTVLGIWDIHAEDVIMLLKYINFKPLIKQLGASINNIDISSNGITADNELIVQIDEAKNLCLR